MSAVDRWLQRAQDYVWEDEIVSPTRLCPTDDKYSNNTSLLEEARHLVKILSADTQARVPRMMRDKRKTSLNVFSATFRRQHAKMLLREDFLKLKQTPKPLNEQLAVLLGMNEGFRKGELVQSRYEDLLPDLGVVYVHDSKDYNKYPLPMDREVFWVLEQIPESEKQGHILKHTFWKTRTHAPVGNKWMWMRIKKLAAEAGVLNSDEWTWTYLRVFFAKEWVRTRTIEGKPANIPMLSALMRHSDPTFTWRYIKKFWYVEDFQRDMARFRLGVQPMREMLADIEK